MLLAHFAASRSTTSIRDGSDGVRNKSKLVEKWTSSQVYEWFLENEIHPQICELYKSVDGLTLKEIHAINVENPMFFYECLRNETNKKIDKEDYESFSQKMKNKIVFLCFADS